VRDIVFGILLAAGASACFNFATVVQAGEARKVKSQETASLALLGLLIKRRRWLAGVAVQAIAIPLQLAALTIAPLAVVQPADATGLVILLIAGQRMLGEKVGWREVASVAAIFLGVVGVALSGPEHSPENSGALSLLFVLAPLALLALAPYFLRRRLPSTVIVLCAGTAFALTAFLMKIVADSLVAGAWIALLVWGAVAGLFAILGLNSEQVALQIRAVAAVAPIIFVIELTLPIALGTIVGGESLPESPAMAALLLGSLLLTIAGAFALMRSGPVNAVLEAEQASEAEPAT
jgi:drug/metabolite transporter (DMT)-like permease